MGRPRLNEAEHKASYEKRLQYCREYQRKRRERDPDGARESVKRSMEKHLERYKEYRKMRRNVPASCASMAH